MIMCKRRGLFIHISELIQNQSEYLDILVCYFHAEFRVFIAFRTVLADPDPIYPIKIRIRFGMIT